MTKKKIIIRLVSIIAVVILMIKGKGLLESRKTEIANESLPVLGSVTVPVIEAFEKMKQEYANYQSNGKQHNLAKESEKIENVRYQNGVSTINDLLYAKSQTHLASAKLIESKYNYQKGKFYMDYLLEKGVEK